VRIILLMGKGGVGKTTVASATALQSAKLGHKTIILSTDSAHSLSDSFNVDLGSEVRQVMPNLWGQEPEISQTLDTQWGTIQKWLSALLAWRGMDEVVADEMAVLPGMEELANLLYIVDYYRSGQYDVIVVDCAPTGETLRLLAFPEVLHWWMTRMFPIGRKAASLVHPLVSLTHIPVPDDEVFASIEHLYSELDQIRSFLTNQDVASVRLVVNPEKMVIKEVQRTFTYLNLYGYSTDLIICNRLIPDEVKDRYFSAWKKSQSEYYKVIEEGFAPLPISGAPLLNREVVGIHMLEVMADAVYGTEDPTKFFFRGQVQDFRTEGKHQILTLSLPFIDKGDISLTRSGNELLVQVGSFKRNIILPHALAGLAATEAQFEEGKLKIQFH